MEKNVLQENDDFEDEDSETDKKSLYKAQEQDNEWSMIVRFRQKKYEDDLKASQLKEKQKKENFRLDLDRQLALKRELDQQNSKKNENLEGRIKDFQQHQEALLSEKMQKRTKLLENEQKARDALFRHINNRNKHEKKQEADLDKSYVIRAKEELNQELENQKKKKMDYQINLRRIMEENEENRAKITEIENFQEKKSVLKAMTEENEMMEKKDSQKKKKTEQIFRESRMKDSYSGLLTDKVLHDRMERIRIEELNHLKYQSEIQNKEMKREEIKRKVLEEQKSLLRSSLEHQMKEKESAKKIEVELNKKQAEFWKNDIEEFHLEEEMKKQKIKEENLKTLGIVKQQMQELGKKKEMVKAMNELELMQNKDILKDIAKDEDGIKKTVITVKKHI